jgi:hypothetical protein
MRIGWGKNCASTCKTWRIIKTRLKIIVLPSPQAVGLHIHFPRATCPWLKNIGCQNVFCHLRVGYVILDILCSLDRSPNRFRTLRSYEGNYNGLYMLYRGEAQVATAHLWDSKTGSYNIPYVEKILPGVPAIIIRLAGRVQDFTLKKTILKA